MKGLILIVLLLSVYGFVLAYGRKRARKSVTELYVCRCCGETEALAKNGVCSACIEINNLGVIGANALSIAEAEMITSFEEWAPHGEYLAHRNALILELGNVLDGED